VPAPVAGEEASLISQMREPPELKTVWPALSRAHAVDGVVAKERTVWRR
jgi:hypothetical protein